MIIIIMIIIIILCLLYIQYIHWLGRLATRPSANIYIRINNMNN